MVGIIEENVVHETDIGAITLDNDALCSIAATAAIESKGVAGLSRDFLDRLKNKLGSAKARGVDIKVEDGNKLTVNIGIFIYYGEKIADVVLEMQRSIKTALEQLAEVDVIAVNVDIDGVKFQKELNV